MAIAHGSTTTASSGGSSSMDITSHTVSGSNPALIVKVEVKSTTNIVTSVTWDSAGVNESLTRLNTALQVNARSDLWYLANPTAKTATVTIVLSDSHALIGAASTYTGVDRNNPFRTAAAATNNGTDDSPTVNIVALNGEMVVDSLAQVSTGPDTATGDHTERHNIAQLPPGTDLRGASQEKPSTGATETMGWTMSAADVWSICAGALQEPQTTSSNFAGAFLNYGVS